jgi:hypothetical protein
MITLKEIPRIKAGTSATLAATGKSLSEIDQERLYLATRAKDVLGYDVLKQSVTGQRKVGVLEGKLTETLLKLDIAVLDITTVIEYQLEEMTRRNRDYIFGHLAEWTGNSWRIEIAKWTPTLLTQYEHPVPEFVLDKAIKIKELLPEVQFHVQHLEDPKADPFLIASLGKEIYYIEAWDEPRFEEKL